MIDLVVQGGAGTASGGVLRRSLAFWRREFKADLERQRKLERCGWHFFIVRESFYRAAPEEALKGLWEMLDRMGIYRMFYSVPEQSDG